jgi:hypothetical protein
MADTRCEMALWSPWTGDARLEMPRQTAKDCGSCKYNNTQDEMKLDRKE